MRTSQPRMLRTGHCHDVSRARCMELTAARGWTDAAVVSRKFVMP